LVERVEPQASVDEATTLAEFLDYYRATLLLKAAGLTDEQARTAASPPSTLNLMGLVRHMAEVERNWYRRVFRGESRDSAPPIFYTDDDTELDMQPPPGATLAEAVAALEGEIAIARQIATDVPLDQPAAIERHGERPNLRWIMVHMIEEYARHCGHADLLREAIDGQTGD
jgi:uncharacterized damage-inducible protein DinB